MEQGRYADVIFNLILVACIPFIAPATLPADKKFSATVRVGLSNAFASRPPFFHQPATELVHSGCLANAQESQKAPSLN